MWYERLFDVGMRKKVTSLMKQKDSDKGPGKVLCPVCHNQKPTSSGGAGESKQSGSKSTPKSKKAGGEDPFKDSFLRVHAQLSYAECEMCPVRVPLCQRTGELIWKTSNTSGGGNSQPYVRCVTCQRCDLVDVKNSGGFGDKLCRTCLGRTEVMSG